MSEFSPEEIERYKRHLVLREIGGHGQQKLKAAKALIIGGGGLGSPLAMYLAAAGVGTIGIVDDDTVSLSNLQRQIAHDTVNIGMAKVESIQATIARINPNVYVKTYPLRINADNALDLILQYDIIADGSDNFATRYLLSDACYFGKRPLVFAALGQFDGYLTTFKPYLEKDDGTPYPTYRCLFPEAPSAENVFNCSQVGVLGAVAGVTGTLQATEVIKEITGVGEGLAGRLVIYDALAAQFHSININWDSQNPLSGTTPTIKDLTTHAAYIKTASA